VHISVAIPTHGDRSQYIVKTVKNIHHLRCIDEIVVCDDGSGSFSTKNTIDLLGKFKKVRLILNENQVFVFKNKLRAVAACTSRNVALLDSDNIFSPDYFKAVEPYVDIRKAHVYCPSHALPRFDWSEFRGQMFIKSNVAYLARSKKFNVLLNTGNYIVERDFYLGALSAAVNVPSCCDVIVAAKHLLNDGARFFVVPNMRYEHTVHDGSTYLDWVNKEPGATEAAQAAIMELK